MWVRTIPEEEATGRLKEAYDWQSQKMGHPTEFTLLGSLDPELVHVRLNLYRVSERCPSDITQRQRALVGYVTSVSNETPHCASQTRLKLLEHGMTEEMIEDVRQGNYDRLPPEEAAVARYARKLTLAPGSVTEGDIEDLRQHGLDDLAIVDVNNMCAHLNYTNRVVNGLGLKTEVSADYEVYAAIPK